MINTREEKKYIAGGAKVMFIINFSTFLLKEEASCDRKTRRRGENGEDPLSPCFRQNLLAAVIGGALALSTFLS